MLIFRDKNISGFGFIRFALTHLSIFNIIDILRIIKAIVTSKPSDIFKIDGIIMMEDRFKTFFNLKPSSKLTLLHKIVVLNIMTIGVLKRLYGYTRS